MSRESNFDCLVVLGPTASGKTKLAVDLAIPLRAEILSMDSRMVYKHLDIGTGKDRMEYTRGDNPVKVHLIDIAEPTEDYQLHRFQQDFTIAFNEIKSRAVLPILCGGSGLYLEACLAGHTHTAIPVNPSLRTNLEKLSLPELQQKFLETTPHPFKNSASTDTRKRLIRSLEILDYLSAHPNLKLEERNVLKPFIIGINPNREQRRMNIEKRLESRLKEGLVEETRALLQIGVPADKIRRFGLEYLWTMNYLENLITYDEMRKGLLIAIQQFAKRQMTWFRKMERSGFRIHWVTDNKMAQVLIEKEFLPFRSR